MNNLISAATTAAAVCLATATIAAQSSTTTASPADKSSANQIVVTGCLQSSEAAATGTAGATGTSGAAASTSGESKFVLASARTQSPDAASTTTASGSSGRTYRLIANDAALGPHVGKKLELTGTMESAGAATTTAGDSQSTGAAANAPLLRVESGKVVAESCSDETPAAKP